MHFLPVNIYLTTPAQHETLIMNTFTTLKNEKICMYVKNIGNKIVVMLYLAQDAL